RELARKLGPSILRDWLLGRYHRPRQEERVFMFLDLRGSTPLAENLGDLRFSGLVREFFADITPAIIETRAEISHYVGDGVLLTWPIGAGLEDANCLRCFFLIRRELARRDGEYHEKFGVCPEFNAG